MTKQEKVDMFAMRLDGATLQKIGDKYGITKERVRQILEISDSKRKPKAKWIYPNMGNYMVEHKISLKEFSEKCEIQYWTLSNYMNGKSEPSIGAIKRMLQFTGMSFEEAFQTKEEQAVEKTN